MSIESRVFGTYQDNEVKLHRLTNGNGVSIEVLDFGARLISVKTPDRQGSEGEITLGFDTMAEYGEDRDYFGATVGRCANRIRDGHFELDGIGYQLAKNNGRNHLHGGVEGFDRRIWRSEATFDQYSDSVALYRESPDGEEGYPGKASATVRYTLNNDNELYVDYEVCVDSPSPINLTNHTFWNLSIENGRDVREHIIQIPYDHYLPVDEGLIPTGEIVPVAGTPMDLRKPVSIGQALQSVQTGFDHSYTSHSTESGLKMIARVVDPVTGRSFEIESTSPAVQFYTGNFLDGTKGRSSRQYFKHFGLCLEPHIHPDAVHHKHFPDVVLRPDSSYKHRTLYRFGTVNEHGGIIHNEYN